MRKQLLTIKIIKLQEESVLSLVPFSKMIAMQWVLCQNININNLLRSKFTVVSVDLFLFLKYSFKFTI